MVPQGVNQILVEEAPSPGPVHGAEAAREGIALQGALWAQQATPSPHGPRRTRVRATRGSLSGNKNSGGRN